MALSYWRGTGDGVTTNYAVPFPYLQQAHVFVSVNGVDTAFTWLTGSTIQISPAPANASTLKIYRKSSPATALVDFTSGFLPEEDLDTAYLHSFYLAQEASDTANDALTLDTTGNYDALSKRIQNVASPAATTDAVPKSYVDSIMVAAGNVPSPVSGDTGKFLKATGAAAYSWQQITTVNVSGLGTAATVNTGTSGGTIPLLSTANTWTLGQTYSALVTANLGMTIVGAGLLLGAATGGQQGVGTINATGVFVNGVALPYQKGAFVSSQKTITANAVLAAVPHGLGVVPTNIQMRLVCTTAEAGYSIGDVVIAHEVADFYNTNVGSTVMLDATNITVVCSASPFAVIHKSTFAATAITPANWKLVILAQA